MMRRLGIVAAACLGGAIGGFVIGRAGGARKEGVTASVERIEFVGRDGVVRGVFGIMEDGRVGLECFDQFGKSRMFAGLGKSEGPRVMLRDRYGINRAILAVGLGDVPLFGLLDEKGGNALSMRLTDGKLPRIHLHGTDGKLRTAMAVDENGPWLGMTAEGGEREIRLEFFESGNGAIALYGGDGMPRSEMRMLADGSPSFNLYDANGVNRAFLALWDQDTRTALHFLDSEKRPVGLIGATPEGDPVFSLTSSAGGFVEVEGGKEGPSLRIGNGAGAPMTAVGRIGEGTTGLFIYGGTDRGVLSLARGAGDSGFFGGIFPKEGLPSMAVFQADGESPLLMVDPSVGVVASPAKKKTTGRY